ncbi:hypothetical protein BDZ97DRAFT_1764137 [Flammula alnicola]|nr:hypothetical protein BDZ97DRAFT_1764137 [Flammula alnicola]
MDYIFGYVLRFVYTTLILISYDICCQWFINLFKRMDEHWPDEIKMRPGVTLIPAIPKLHEPMHRTADHEKYSLNYIKGCGHSDCECPECVWGPHNVLGNSTKTQGPGSRHDVYDDHFGFWNWLKYIGLGLTLLRKYKAAVAQQNLQQKGHRGLTESLDPEPVKNWEKMCVNWEQAAFPKQNQQNLYYLKDAYLSEMQVKKELAEEEERRLAAGGVSLHATSAWYFIQMGLDLEDTQRHLQCLSKAIASKLTRAIGQEQNLMEEQSNLRVRFRAWEKLVPIYLPGLLQYQMDLARNASKSDNVPRSEKPEDADVWLPLEYQLWLEIGFVNLCRDSLQKVRRVLKVKSRMIHFKNKNIRGQRDGTRSRAVINRIHMKARNAANRYRAARQAKLALAGPGKWEETLRILEDKDIQAYQDLNPGKSKHGHGTNKEQEFELFNEARRRCNGTGETHRTLSWIWLTTPLSEMMTKRMTFCESSGRKAG